VGGAASALAAACALACAAGGLHAVRVIDVGHAGRTQPWSALAADVAMARAQVYFGSQLEARAPAGNLGRYLDEAVDLDPSARARYLRGAAMLVYSGPVITAEAVLAADRLLERGTRTFPDDGELWFQIGFNDLYELPRLVDPGDPRRQAWRRQGVAAMARAARLRGAPPWLGALAAELGAREER
jgi:hypothetical protein